MERPGPAAIVGVPLLAILGVLSVLVVMMPLGLDDRLAPPDLLYALLVAWVIRRPRGAPFVLVVSLGLFADLMLSRPLGLGALMLVLAVELFRQRARLFWGVPFALEWLAVLLAFAVLLAVENLVLAVAFVPPPGLVISLQHLAATAVAYPLVVLGLTWCLGVRAPEGTARMAGGRMS